MSDRMLGKKYPFNWYFFLDRVSNNTYTMAGPNADDDIDKNTRFGTLRSMIRKDANLWNVRYVIVNTAI